MTIGKNDVGPVTTKLAKESYKQTREEIFDHYWGTFTRNICRFLPRAQELPLEVFKHIYSFLYDCIYFVCSFDARYSSMGWNALEATFTICESLRLHKIIDVIHVSKYRPGSNIEQENQIIGASSAMEGEALNIWMRRTLIDEYEVNGIPICPRIYVHDRDGKAREKITDFYLSHSNQFFIPQEANDGAHSKKNFVHQVRDLDLMLGESAGRYWSFVKAMVHQIFAKQGFNRACTAWKKAFNAWPCHKNGDHSQCTDTCTRSSTRFNMKKPGIPDKFAKFVAICKVIAGRAAMYVKDLSTGLNESLNRMYKCGGDKTIDYRVGYRSRMDGEALRYNVGNDACIIQLADKLDFKLSNAALGKLSASQHERERHHRVRMSTKGKADKVQQKLRIRNFHKAKEDFRNSKAMIVSKEDETFYAKSFADKNKRSLIDASEEPPKKKARVFNGHCNCGKGGCADNRCLCKKNNQKCNSSCHTKTESKCSNCP
jgi:hypothetical protein